jgi:hypothetical protein
VRFAFLRSSLLRVDVLAMSSFLIE